MTPLDIIIVFLIFISAVFGIFYGFLNIFFSFLSWGIAVFLSIKLMPYVSPFFEGYINTPMLRDILSFAVLFFLSLFILTGVGYLIVKLLKREGLSAVDRVLGMLLGLGLGGLTVALTVFLAGFTAFPKEPFWTQSSLVEPFEEISVQSAQYLPASLKEYHGYE